MTPTHPPTFAWSSRLRAQVLHSAEADRSVCVWRSGPFYYYEAVIRAPGEPILRHGRSESGQAALRFARCERADVEALFPGFTIAPTDAP